MKVFQPYNAIETSALIRVAADIDDSCYIRLGHCVVENVYNDEDYIFEPGKGIILSRGIKIAIIAGV